jgi:hypothetical protein
MSDKPQPNETPTQVLDDLLDTLQSRLDVPDHSARDESDDAIDEVLQSPARRTQVRPLRDAPEMAAFRQALTDGMIRVDTVNRLLRLINEIVVKLI